MKSSRRPIENQDKFTFKFMMVLRPQNLTNKVSFQMPFKNRGLRRRLDKRKREVQRTKHQRNKFIILPWLSKCLGSN